VSVAWNEAYEFVFKFFSFCLFRVVTSFKNRCD